MPSTQELKRRTKAVTNIKQITKAMEMVAATKMRRSQEIALRSRSYAVEILRLLGELTEKTNYLPDIMKSRSINKTTLVLVAADRGLAGSFNANIFRSFEKWLNKHNDKLLLYSFIAVGKKAEEFLSRKGFSMAASFKNFGDYIKTKETRPLSHLLTDNFLKGGCDQVIIFSTHFRTTLRQEVMIRELLPITAERVKQAIKEIIPEYGRYANLGTGDDIEEQVQSSQFEYLIEPDSKSVLDALAPQLLEIVIHDFILEANASEHAARRLAMKTASDNASDLGSALNLQYNKSRQGAITSQIIEIIAGAESLN